MPILVFDLVLIYLCLCHVAQSANQHCIDKAIRNISVNIYEYNPYKVLTYIRDAKGYARNLHCRWVLRASDYTNPRQMLLTVANVDFDESSGGGNGTLGLCNTATGSADVFSFAFSGQLTSGVQLNVQILSRDYCYVDMLYHENYCYFITKGLLTFDEAARAASYMLGSVTAFTDADAALRFVDANIKRGELLPMIVPLDLTSNKLWTGAYKDAGDAAGDSIRYLDPLSDCNEVRFKLPLVNASSTESSNCGVAFQLVSGRPVFTCEPTNQRLPALIKFAQIPLVKKPAAAAAENLFVTCFTAWVAKHQPAACSTGCIVGIVAGALALAVALCFLVACCRRKCSWKRYSLTARRRQNAATYREESVGPA
uniref:CUB domain-containing protein n=1 Tax=Macrostomum lignano TaxID=282301 RepID=A0A1I8GC78_9PLAT